MHRAVITLEQLRKVYPGRGARDDVVALAGIDLHVERGTVHGIVGQSGAGKSTLVRCLTALERPTSGRVVIDGQDLTGLGERALRRQRRNIGMVHQHVNLFDARTAAANIAYPLAIAKTPRAQQATRVAELLDLVGLAGRGESYPSQLSGGQKQRVGIARALAADPHVLLCDEPTSALDSQTTAQILDLIRDVRDRLGVTVVIITHEMDVVRRACDTVTLLDQGRVAQSGTLEDVVSDAGSRLSRALVPLPPVPEVPAGQRVLDVFFTSRPGRPDAARVMDVVARVGADIAAGTMETLGAVQVGRLALTVGPDRVGEVLTALQGAGAFAEVRA